MPKYIQVDNGVNLKNNKLHIPIINNSEIILSLLSQRLGDKPISLVYDSDLKRTKPHSNFEEQPILSKLFSENVNCLLDLLESHNNNTFACLYHYFQFIVDSQSKYNSDIYKIVFSAFDLSDIFDENETFLLKYKLNTLLALEK